MTNNFKKFRRRSIRLKGYDYSQTGAYFVTICTFMKECIFGHIEKGRMILNNLGKIVNRELIQTGKRRKNVRIDDYIIMPNHIHIILIIQRRGTARRARSHEISHTKGTARCAPTPGFNQFGKPTPASLPTIVRSFKSAATNKFNQMHNSTATPIWQRNYYEHIIRHNDELKRYRQYIRDNPQKWFEDEYNPDNIKN